MCPVFHVPPEHQVRELLNLIQLLERCLILPDASPDERAGWGADLTDARTRLADLLAADRDGAPFLHRLTTLAGESDALRAPGTPSGSDLH